MSRFGSWSTKLMADTTAPQSQRLPPVFGGWVPKASHGGYQKKGNRYLPAAFPILPASWGAMLRPHLNQALFPAQPFLHCLSQGMAPLFPQMLTPEPWEGTSSPSSPPQSVARLATLLLSHLFDFLLLSTSLPLPIGIPTDLLALTLVPALLLSLTFCLSVRLSLSPANCS